MPETFDTALMIETKFQVSPAGRFQILAITAGVGNGLTFRPDVLKDSLPLWQGVSVFVDHNGTRARSVMQLAGTCSSPEWDDVEQGIRLQLTTAGPAAEVVNELGRLVLSNEVPDLNVGFSADVSLLIDGNTVKKVIKPHSLDVVYNPARGGRFLRVLNQAHDDGQTKKENVSMTDPVITPPAATQPPSAA